MLFCSTFNSLIPTHPRFTTYRLSYSRKIRNFHQGMKRKRGNKKGKAKGRHGDAKNEAAINIVTLNSEDNSGVDESDNIDEYASRMEVDTPSSTGTDQPLNVASINPDGSIDKTTGKSVGRVKVKLKTSKTMESQSDTDKSSLQVVVDKRGVAGDKLEDSDSSLHEAKISGSGNVSKTPGSIKIKSSKGLGVLSSEKSSTTVVVPDDSLPPKEIKAYQRSRYNKEELNAALTVIKKVMKMDAAEPFNVPVNPEALGIPDYFEVIDTPMDFGTICSNLEKGHKYKNSEDVYKDVQYIWDNCYKYNSKGDYILDLMRRVKKNFMKYWTAARLYTEQGAEGVQSEDVAVSSQGNARSGQPKQKTKKRHGRRHKGDCLCAICVLKRRRREREENARLFKSQSGVAEKKLAQQLKQEDSSLRESPHADDSSSNMGESVDPDADGDADADADADTEVKGTELEVKDTKEQDSLTEKHEEDVREDEDEGEEEEDDDEDEERNGVEIQRKEKDEMPEQLHFGHRLEELNQQSLTETADNTGSNMQMQTLEGHAVDEDIVIVQEHELKFQKLEERRNRAHMLEKFHVANPMLLGLCNALFPEKRGSVWNGSHSLFQHQSSGNGSSIHAAVEMLMK
ncbi:hypothetical protein K2173_022265 [Erythroxylum novogranatense]|uniref:Bromo domain-containing protein n=1 Tax=Erythroxylum novogranatense TaxID=1862640 RepID=A0AAV8SUS3_9ROSI|nr:hypothetical protein K2173_022265 [Erythroxylum novogranatense]